MDRGKLIWLWLIRENQPVSFRELLQRIIDETADIPAPPALLEDFYISVHRRGLNDVMELINLGLVTTENDQPFAHLPPDQPPASGVPSNLRSIPSQHLT